MNDIVQDLRFAFRTFRKNAGFTSVVLVTVAIGIGANTAIFGLMDQLLIRLLPVAEPERLVVLDGPGPFSGSTHNNSEVMTPFSHPMFEGLRDGNEVFSGVLAHYQAPIHLTVGDATENVSGDLVSGSFFPTLGVKPRLGRLFSSEDDVRPGGHPVVVLSHGFWVRRFARRTDVLGQAVRVNGEPMTIVGVAERGFHGVDVGGSVDVFVPLMMQAQVIPTWTRGLGDWRARWLTVMARLEDDVTPEEARAGANLLYRQLLQEDLKSVETQSQSFRERFVQKELTVLP
ncbi:MAG: ABC transporter permease, partial [Vicinamibacteria bacterium]